jgi:hypothetical protein
MLHFLCMDCPKIMAIKYWSGLHETCLFVICIALCYPFLNYIKLLIHKGATGLCRTFLLCFSKLHSNIIPHLCHICCMPHTSSSLIWLLYGLDDQGVRVPAGAGSFFLHYHIHACFGPHSASYRMGTMGSFSGDKAAGAWTWPFTYI